MVRDSVATPVFNRDRDGNHLALDAGQARRTAHEMGIELHVSLERGRIQRVDLEYVIQSFFAGMACVEFCETPFRVLFVNPIDPRHEAVSVEDATGTDPAGPPPLTVAVACS